MKQKKTRKQEKQGETRRNPVINRSKPWETMRETRRNQEKPRQTKRNKEKTGESLEKPWEIQL